VPPKLSESESTLMRAQRKRVGGGNKMGGLPVTCFQRAESPRASRQCQNSHVAQAGALRREFVSARGAYAICARPTILRLSLP